VPRRLFHHRPNPRDKFNRDVVVDRSDIELTKTLRGFDHACGASNDFSSNRILPVQTALPPLFQVRPRYFSVPIASSLAAIRMA
jgi:hypothetical protein